MDNQITADWLMSLGGVPIDVDAIVCKYTEVAFNYSTKRIRFVPRRLGWVIDIDQDKKTIAMMTLTTKLQALCLLSLMANHETIVRETLSSPGLANEAG